MTGATDLLTQERRGSVLVLRLARAPVNALNAAMLRALGEALAAAEAEPEVQAVVLSSVGPHFSAGLDVSELGRVADAALPEVAARVEALKKPVVAALQGNVLGGGLELALACHGRVAQDGARLSFPEIGLGLLPVAGSTQRLPRLVGAPVALNMLVDGASLSALEALAMGLVDAVVESAPETRAEALALELSLASPIKTADRIQGLRDPLAYQSAITEMRKRLAGTRLPAPHLVVDCVEAAQLLPFEAGLGFERAHAETMAESAEAAGLRHAFLSERRALTLPASLSGAPLPRLGAVMVVGASGLAPEVAAMALSAGLKVRLVAANRSALAEALQKIATRQELMVAEGRLAPATREADWARLSGALPDARDAVADLVLTTADAPAMPDLPGPSLALGGERGDVVLHPAPVAGALALLALQADAPLPKVALGLAFGRALGWKMLVQGPGLALDHRLRLVLARAIAALEGQGEDRERIKASLAAFGMGAANRARLPQAPASSEAILRFCLAALANEGAKMIQDGAARRAGDVDAAAVLSGLFPRWEGGPLFHADRQGLMALRADLRARAGQFPDLFAPAGILDQMIDKGQRFADLARS